MGLRCGPQPGSLHLQISKYGIGGTTSEMNVLGRDAMHDSSVPKVHNPVFSRYLLTCQAADTWLIVQWPWLFSTLQCH